MKHNLVKTTLAGLFTVGLLASCTPSQPQKKLVDITIESQPTKVSYFVGETFSKAGLKVNANFSNKTSEEISDYTLNPADGYTFVEADAGNKQFTVTYQEKTATFTVEVKAVVVTAITVKTQPTKTSYFVGDQISTDGLTLEATYNNGTTETISTGFTTNASDIDMTTGGTKSITVSFGGQNATFDISVDPWVKNALNTYLTSKNVEHDNLPELTGASNVVLETDKTYDIKITVTPGEGQTAANLVTSYISALTTAGYAPVYNDYYDDHYGTEYQELDVCVYQGSATSVVITADLGMSAKPATLGFPAQTIASKLATKWEVTDTLPENTFFPLNGYSVYEGESAVQAYTYTSNVTALNAALTGYRKALTDNGYTDEDGDYSFTSPNKQIEVVVAYGTSQYSTYGVYTYIIEISQYVPDVEADWPEEDLAPLFAEYFMTDPVPAFEGAKEFIIDDSGYYAPIEIKVTLLSTVTAADALTAYIGKLTTAGYTEGEDGAYGGKKYISSPDQSTVVYPYNYNGTIYIDFFQNLVVYEEFPTDLIADYFEENLEATIPVPAYAITDAEGYFEREFTAFMGCEKAINLYANGSVATDLEAYGAALVEAGWELSSSYYGDPIYNFPGTGAYAYLGNYSDYGEDYDILTFYWLGEQEAPEGWPTDDLEAALIAAEIDYELPYYLDSSFVSAEVERVGGMVYLDITVTGDVFDGWDYYASTIMSSDANMEVADMDLDTYVLTLTNGDVEITLKPVEDGNIVAVSITNAGPAIVDVDNFPSDVVLEAFDTLEEIPLISGEGLTFQYVDESMPEIGFSAISILVNGYADEEAAATAAAAYVAALGEAGFVLDPSTSSEEEGYYNLDFVAAEVSASIELDGTSIMVAFYTYMEW